MFPAAFDYVRANSLDDVFAAFKKYGTDARVLAGGQSLIPAMRYRLAQPAVLVDINPIGGLSYLKEDSGALKIGALTRHADIEFSKLVRDKYPMMADVAYVVADPIVRNRGTLCGAIAHNDPAADWTAAALAARASVVATSAKGSRTIAIDDFLVDSFSNALQPGELVTEVVWPTPDARTRGAYVKVERKVGDFATVAVAGRLTLDAQGNVAGAGIGLCAVGATALRAKNAEKTLAGGPPTDERIAAAAEAAAKESDPAEDTRGSVDFKRDLVRVLVARALTTARDRIKGSKS
ncbi:MAG: xanthine dehydrogenase family protein subunit M [Candidatus Eremiobacteraeota bacterium]|nr:xanthine dehydrogenase family protein subunit M [Candidatus Eremiobacteraeota bacterium]